MQFEIHEMHVVLAHDVLGHSVDDDGDALRVLDVFLDVVVAGQGFDEPEGLLDHVLVLVGIDQEVEHALEATVVHHGLAVLVPHGQAAQAREVEHQVVGVVRCVFCKMKFMS